MLSNRFEQNRSNNRIINALSFLNFTSRLLIKPKPISSYHSNVTAMALETFTASSTFLNSISFSFQIIILTTKIIIEEFDCENGCVFISLNAMENKFKCSNGQWVRIWLLDHTIDTTKPKHRYCQLYAIESINDDNIAYISPQLWFNLQHFCSQLTIKPLIQPNTTLMIKKDELIGQQISYATAIHVSLVRSPNYSATDDYSIILKSYFKKARYIVKGDIIGINSKDDEINDFDNKQLSLRKRPVIYFRVTLIEGNGCVVDVNNSKLYQTGTVHSLIPVTLNTYYSLNATISDSSCFVGLSKYVHTLCDIVYPYLKLIRKTIGTIVIDGPSGSGKQAIVKSMCEYWNLHLLQINANEIIGDTASSTEAKIKIALSKSSIYSPCVVLISQFDLLCNREFYSDHRIYKAFNQELKELVINCEEWPIIIIATVIDDKRLIDSDLSSLFLHKIFIDCPDFEERKSIIKSLVGEIPISCDVNLTELVNKTSGLYFGDLCVIIANALTDLYYNLTNNSLGIIDETDFNALHSGVVLSNCFIMNALNALQRQHSDAFGSPSIPEVHWADIGGLDNVKREILDTIQLPLEYPQLLKAGFRRSGVLLYGPPGTGKTLLAKAAATQCSLNFLSVKGPELINMYVGQSEENIRNIFKRARSAAPCVIFFDELDSLAPNRGNSGDSGGVMDRVVSQLLAEMDGINKSNNVFVIATTNRPDLLDSALLRPGRFDRLIHVAIASDSSSRIKILQALTKNFSLDNDVKLENIESLCPPQLSGADIYSLCSNALINAITRSICDIENHSIIEEDCTIKVFMSDFEFALTKFNFNSIQI